MITDFNLSSYEALAPYDDNVLKILKEIDENPNMPAHVKDPEKCPKTDMTKGQKIDSHLKIKSDEIISHQYDKADDNMHDIVLEKIDNFKLFQEKQKETNELRNKLTQKTPSKKEIDNLIKTLKAEKFQAKLLLSPNQVYSFLLKNHIDPFTISHESHVYLELQYPQIELNFEKEQMLPSSELYAAVIKSLKNHNPHYELMKIFETYGHFMPKRIIIGYKLHRMSSLIVKDSPKSYVQEIDFDVIDFEMPHDFDATYLISVDGATVMRNELDMWMKDCLKDNYDSPQVVNWKELYPLYEIFDESLQRDVKSIFGIDEIAKIFGVKEKVLTTGVIPTEHCAYQYRVKFPVNFKSNNYQIFGKLVKHDGEQISEAVIKFKSTNKYGFSAKIENFEISE
ncbi:33081_t:CDS:2 [Racocetra persica]|uniref:33081_t:CDS:1 n=1 Tax=Racocetra persica TaxID=160502 RepID=A0ACA9MVP4_9GLOM|nr:33081_t:CDS:2 [Racocetra persica]